MNIKPLLDFIAEHESESTARRLKISAYDVVWGGIRKQHRPPKSLRTMTVAEVLAWQDGIDPLYQSEASGRYQIMEDTLRVAHVAAGVRLTDLYDEKTQDRLAVHLMRGRGLDLYLNGAITAEHFANQLAREWASLPVVSGKKKGRSFYDGDGLNKSLVDVEPFLAAVRAVKQVTTTTANEAGPEKPQAAPQSTTPKPAKPTLWQMIVQLFREN
jgi:muramidase (phage lysozyme)